MIAPALHRPSPPLRRAYIPTSYTTSQYVHGGSLRRGQLNASKKYPGSQVSQVRIESRRYGLGVFAFMYEYVLL